MMNIKSNLLNIALFMTVLSGLAGCSGQSALENSFINGQNIVGGEAVAWSDQISRHTTMLINLETNEICSGVLVAPRVVLTAGHCLPADKENIKVYFSINPLSDDANGEVGSVGEVALHPQYSSGKELDSVDLAILVLTKSAPVHYRPVSINDSEIQVGSEVVLAGFGNSTAIKSDGFGQLRKVTVNISRINSPLFFEIDQTSGRGICDGDSGGPVFQKEATKLTLVGITKLTYDRDETGYESCLTTSQYTALENSAIKNWILEFSHKAE